MPKPLSKEAEAKIVGALQKVVDLVDDGTPVTDAFTKVATTEQVPHGHLRYMVYAYNTGRTTANRQASDDTFAKAASFPLADYDAILSRLYPSTTKTAAQLHSETKVSNDYDRPPNWVGERRSLEKAASLHFTAEKQAAAPINHPDLGNPLKLQGDMTRLRRGVEDAYSKMAHCQRELTANIDDLKFYFRTDGHRPFQEVFQNAIAMHGKTAAHLRDHLLEDLPYLAKQAGYDPLQPATGGPYRLVADCLKKASEFFACRDVFEETLKTASAQRLEYLSKVGESLPAPLPTDSVLGEASFAERVRGLWPLPFAEKAAAPFDRIANVSKNMATAKAINEVSSHLPVLSVLGKSRPPEPKAVMDPTHASELRNVNLQAMLSDFMMNDPVIRSHDPQDILNAFNELAKLTPRSASQPLVARAWLRKRLSTSEVDPFEVGELVNTEGKLRGNSELKAPPPSVMG